MHDDSMLALRLSAFWSCGNIEAGMGSRPVPFKVAGWGTTITVHRSYDPQTVDAILRSAHGDGGIRYLALPLGRYKKYNSKSGGTTTRAMVLPLSFDHATGEWRRLSASETSQPGVQISMEEDVSRRILMTALHSLSAMIGLRPSYQRKVERTS